MLSITSEITDTFTNTNNIRKMAEYKCRIKVLRYGQEVELTSDELVPGDLVVLPKDGF